jgi:hypothetical protein
MPIKLGRAGALLCVAIFAVPPGNAAAQAQDPMPGMSGHDMSNIDMSDHDMNNAASMDMPGMPGMSQTGGTSGMKGMSGMSSTGVLGGYPMTRDASGTSWQPDLASHGGVHLMAGDWMLMLHGTLWGIYDTQSGPRGDDKFFAAGMFMGMARRDFGGSDTLQFRAMLSPDPFMGRSGYPLLLATGETADGVRPLIDRQHPHDLLMELSSAYSHKFSTDDSAFLYFGYPGEPALGPPAFMHRGSGLDIPEAPITHHWLDSTHITFGVLTAGFVHDDWKLEVSQFTGREPDQFRFNFDGAKFDSTAARVSYNPDAHWSLQASWGFLKSPEQLEPTTDENRFTASASYVTKWGAEQSVAMTAGWGLKDLSDEHRLNGLFAETEYQPAKNWTAFARAEWEQNAELDIRGITRAAGELTLGGVRDFPVADHVKLGLGASYSFDFVPSSLAPSYGSDPHDAMVFTRIVLD